MSHSQELKEGSELRPIHGPVATFLWGILGAPTKPPAPLKVSCWLALRFRVREPLFIVRRALKSRHPEIEPPVGHRLYKAVTRLSTHVLPRCQDAGRKGGSVEAEMKAPSSEDAVWNRADMKTGYLPPGPGPLRRIAPLSEMRA